MSANLGFRSTPPLSLRSRGESPLPSFSLRLALRSVTNLDAAAAAAAVVGSCRPLLPKLRCHVGRPDLRREEAEEEEIGRGKIVRTLLIDNYDSYTYNIYQELSIVNGVPPVVIHNDEWTVEHVLYMLYEEKAFDNVVISPGPGSPACPRDIGICLEILRKCEDIPILGVCLGHQGTTKNLKLDIKNAISICDTGVVFK